MRQDCLAAKDGVKSLFLLKIIFLKDLFGERSHVETQNLSNFNAFYFLKFVVV